MKTYIILVILIAIIVVSLSVGLYFYNQQKKDSELIKSIAEGDKETPGILSKLGSLIST